MRYRPSLGAVLSLAVLSLVPAAVRVSADVGASGTRMAIGDAAPRFYMTYGHAEEPELKAVWPSPAQLAGIPADRLRNLLLLLDFSDDISAADASGADEETEGVLTSLFGRWQYSLAVRLRDQDSRAARQRPTTNKCRE